ncbi:hypothetical protein L3Q82_010661 [Scortum barcoo]|uniref:Uncharacterized protein n=1 Tax=Scortum barcoo TaxID=214431 RepID=A0ACB8WCV8_9TELE|nr:hypothetical protein L3Q82_010661 [Scortum barcoo]
MYCTVKCPSDPPTFPSDLPVSVRVSLQQESSGLSCCQGPRSFGEVLQEQSEFKYFRDGATVVVSLDGLNWLSKRRCKGVKKRTETEIMADTIKIAAGFSFCTDMFGVVQKQSQEVLVNLSYRGEELQLMMPSGQMIRANEELEPITCFCVLDRRGGAAPQLWRSSDCKSSPTSWLPFFSNPARLCHLPEEPTHRSAFTSLAAFISECLKEAPWTRLILNMQDILSWIKKDLNIVTQEDTSTINQHSRFIIFCDEDIPLQLFSDTSYTEDCRTTSIGDTGWHLSDNDILSDLKNSTATWPHIPNTNNSESLQHELAIIDKFNTCHFDSPVKSFQNDTSPGRLSRRDKHIKKKKSVSFYDDVTVYLFDQESPTVELHPGPYTSLPSSYSCNLSDVTLEDSGLEWEDDFSALEKSCHFRCVRQPASRHYTLSLPTPSCTALSGPERFSLSQTCLFLTHVTESDLEL